MRPYDCMPARCTDPELTMRRSARLPEPADDAITVARLHGPGDVRIHNEPAPTAGPGELILHVTAVGLCGSDRHWYEDGRIGDDVLTRPLVLGHEFAAVIASGPRAGQRVAVDPADPCGTCPPCRGDEPHLCLDQRFAGHSTTDGALRSRLAWPERLCHSVPDDLVDVEAALLEPLGVALHAATLGRLGDAERVGVFGCGPIGLLLVQVLRAAGVTPVIATDRLSHRIEAARRMGAVDTLGAGDDALLSDLGLDVAFEAAGDDAAVAAAIRSVRPGGRVVLVGIPGDDRTSFVASTARRKELSFIVSRRMRPSDMERAIGMARSRTVALRPLVTDVVPLDRTPQAFQTLEAQRGLKVIVRP